MGRILTILQVCWCLGCLLGAAARLLGDEPRDAKQEKLSDDSRSRAEGIQVSVRAGSVTTQAKVCPEPLMKYTDVPRLIEMATLWVWQDEGCPMALGKVEAYQRKEGTKWLYCFTSASTGLVEADWQDGRRFAAKKPGVEWAALDGPAPQETAAGRLRQMKTLFRRFSTTVRDDVLKTSDDLRPLPRPLHEYASPGKGVLQGVLFGFAANGTNPDVIVVLEAVSPAGGKGAPKSWRYGVIGMTASGISVKLDNAEVYTRPYARTTGDQETWTYFWEGAPRK